MNETYLIVPRRSGKSATVYYIDAIDAARYAFMNYKTLNRIKEDNKMATEHKTESELRYHNTLNEIDNKQVEAIEEARKAADAARYEAQQKLEREKLKEDRFKEALNYWYFFEGLIDAGFEEEDAMRIMLNKMPAYTPPVSFYSSL